MRSKTPHGTWFGAGWGLAFGTVLLLLEASSASADEKWEQVFDMPAQRAGLACVLADAQRGWTAGGWNVLVVGTEQGHERLALNGELMEAFGLDADGVAYAVGASESIWKRTSRTEWHQEHRLPHTVAKAWGGHDAHVLVGVHRFASGSGEVLAAYGSPSLVFVQNAHGDWRAVEEREHREQLFQLATMGPRLELPPGCQRLQWRWIDHRDGLLQCRDLRAFGLLDGKLVPMGRMPSSCNVLRSVVRRGDDFFTSCGSEGTLWRFGPVWTRVSGPTNLRALSANEQCVVVASGRSVWRQCVGTR